MRPAVFAALLAGCYAPATEAPCRVRCDQNLQCPGALTCDTNDGLCKSGGMCPQLPADAAPPDLPPDVPQPYCYGSPVGLFHPCFDSPPGLAIDWAAPGLTIDTDQQGACDYVVATTTGPLCVLVRNEITVHPAAVVRVTGRRPLVLIATMLEILGVIDASSSPTTLGAGGNHPSCTTGIFPSQAAGGGGGSFRTRGGNGGSVNGIGAGIAPGVVTPTTVRGGCPGQAGSMAAITDPPGGGAIYLIAKSALLFGPGGGINVSGAPGPGTEPQTGGNGGGAGGMIGIDTPALTDQGGFLRADGGGGGCGGGTNPGNAGTKSSATVLPQGCRDANADGGDAAYGTFPARDGRDVSSAGGGGGGGGSGWIFYFPNTLRIADQSPAPLM